MGTILVCLVLSSATPPPVVAPAPAFSQEEVDAMVAAAADKAKAEAKAEAAKETEKLKAENKAMAEKLRVSAWKVHFTSKGKVPSRTFFKYWRVDIGHSKGTTHMSCVTQESGGVFHCFFKNWSGCSISATKEKVLMVSGCPNGSPSSAGFEHRKGIKRDLHKILATAKW